MFECREPQFMLLLFTTFIRPLLEYAVQLWSPSALNLVDALERVQRRYTKRMAGLSTHSYQERLVALGIPSLKFRRDFLIACFTYKLVQNMLNMSITSLGLQISTNNTRSQGVKLFVHRPYCTLFKNSFCHRATVLWNSLPTHVITCTSLAMFKRRLSLHLFSAVAGV